MHSFLNPFSSKSRILHGIGLVFATLAFTLLLSHNAQAAACPATDGGAGDGDGTANGIITINANTTWNPVDATAWDCSGLDLLVTNNATLTFGSVTASGYYGYLQIDNLQIDNGAAISSNARGCPGIPGWSGGGPNTSTNVCGQYVSGYGRIGGGASGAGHGGAGGAGSTMSTVGTTYGSSTAPVLFGSSGGGENNFGPQTTGGAGGGIVRISISENFLFNGSISANGGNGTTGGYGYAAGGGSGGSIYIVVSGAITGSTGSLSATGGAGGNNTSDGGGGGGGRISISGYDQTSFLSALSASVVVAGGSGPDSAADGSTGSLDTSLLYSRPSTPSLSSPLTASYNNSVNLNITSSSYSSNGGAHTTSDWMLKTSNNCSTIDDRVWYKNDDSGNKTSITVNSTNGTFTGALSGQTALTSNTQYYACVRHSNLSGDSDWSTAIAFTTAYSGFTSTQTWHFNDASSNYSYDPSSLVVNSGSNSLVQLIDLGGGTYSVGSAFSGWSRRKPLTVTNSVASVLTNHQIKFTVTYDADMQVDFDDLRFTNSSGSALDYWIESKSNGVSATVWVEVDSLAASSETTLYMYYGNAGASAGSNGSNVFVKFDDFSNGSTLSNIWTTKNTDANRTITQGSGALTIANSVSANADWWSGIDLAPHAYTAVPSGDWSAQVTLTAYTDNSSTQGGIAAVQSWTNAAQSYLWGRHNGGTSGRILLAKLGTQGLVTVSNNTLPLTLRIRQIGTTKYYDYSVDGGVNWTSSYNSTEMNVAYISLFQKEWGGNTSSSTFDNFFIRNIVSTEPSVSTGSELALVAYDSIKILPSESGAHPGYTGLYSFSETLGAGNQGSVKYQISRNGTDWYYFNTSSGTWTTVSVDSVDANTATLVNAYLPKFVTDVGTGELYFKAFLISNGSQRVELDSISLSYAPPVILTSITITDNAGYTNDTTPVITAVSAGATPTHIAFSCNGGSNWSAWLTYPDDNISNDDDGPAFDITSGATGCSGSDGVKTISAKIKDGSSESSSVSDSTTLDTTAPTVSNVSSTNADGTYGAAEVITVTVQFSDTTMQVTGTPQIQLDMDGTDRQAGYSSTSTDTLSFTYTIATGDNKTDLDYTGTGALTLNGGTIADLAGNTATLTLASPGAAGSLGANKALNIVTNQAPTVSSITGALATNASGDVTITFIMDDPDNDDTLQAQVEYSLNGGSSWADPTLSITGSETSATYGDPGIDNAQTRQVGQGTYITSSSGANTVSIVWEAATDIAASTDIANARIRITPYDGTIEGSAGSSSDFIIDLVDPSGLGAFTDSSFSSSSIVLTWNAATDSNFDHYEIWYGSSQSEVQNRSGAAVEWDNGDDGALATANTTTTTIGTNPSNLYFKIFAVDDYGNESTVADILPNQSPTVSSITAAQETDGSGLVTIGFTVDDPDNDDTLQVKVEYSLNGGSTWADPTLSVVDGDTVFAFGDPDVDNAQTRQVGQMGAYLLSSSGANAGSIVWNTVADIAASTDISNARIRLTPYDGTIEGGTGTSANFIIDLVNPTGLAGLGDSGFTSSQITLTWTAAADSNFDHYEIWYGQNETDVGNRSGSASEWDDDNDAGLATAGTTTTVLVTNPRNMYFQIFAVDDFGNEASSSSYFRSYSSGTPAPGPVPSPGSSNNNNDDDEEEDEEEKVEEEAPSPLPEAPAVEHWAEGYMDYLDSQESVVEMAAEIPTFMDILVDLILNPDSGMDRGEATEFLLVFADYSVTTMSVDSRPSFTDVDEAHPRQFFIELATELGLVNGYEDGSFQPDLVINRVEVLKMVTYFFGIEVDTSLRGDELLAEYELTKNPLTDVDLDSWYAPYVIHAYANGVVKGYGDGTFGPGNNVTKAEFLKMAILYQNFGDAVQLASELE